MVRIIANCGSTTLNGAYTLTKKSAYYVTESHVAKSRGRTCKYLYSHPISHTVKVVGEETI
jgi:hypothetical protein